MPAGFNSLEKPIICYTQLGQKVPNTKLQVHEKGYIKAPTELGETCGELLVLRETKEGVSVELASPLLVKPK